MSWLRATRKIEDGSLIQTDAFSKLFNARVKTAGLPQIWLTAFGTPTRHSRSRPAFTPHRCAQAASVRIRSGLSPAATSSLAVESYPTPYTSSNVGAVWRIKGRNSPLSRLVTSPKRLF